MYEKETEIQKVCNSPILCEKIAELEREIFEVESWSKELIVSEFNNPSSEVWVLRNSWELLGYLIIRKILDEAEILRIGIKSEFRGRGLGKKFLSYVLHVLKKEGVKKVFLEVNIKNNIAYNFYKRLGFEELGIRKKYYLEGDAIIMAKNLEEE